MSETEIPSPEPTATTEKNCARGHRRRGGFARKALGFFLIVGAAVGIPLAVAQASGHGGFGGHCGGAKAVTSAEELRTHMDKPAGWILGKVNATDEQTAQIDAVLDRLAPELFALKAEHEEIRQDFHAALTAPQINGAEIEEIRKDGLTLADEASKVVIGGIVDVANVLDAEQRGELGKMAERWHK